ncbi:MAG: apolipoprotein N-acyltransferase [Pseudomonadales bacterium]
MKYILSLLCGALLPLSLAPFDLWPLGILSVSAWFLLSFRDPRHAPLLAYLFAFGKYAVGASWVYVSIHVYGNASVPLAVFLVGLFVAGLALFGLAFGWAFRLLARGALLSDALLFAVLVVALEWLLTWFLTGFPWLYLGYAHLETPLAGFAPVGGILLVGLAAALSATQLAVLLRGSGHQRLVAVVVLLALWGSGWLLTRPAWVTPVSQRSVALVQGNIDQGLKWRPENRASIVRTYTDLSEPYWGVDLMIWPEAAITLMAHEAGPVLEQLSARAAAAGTALVLGLPALERLPGGEIVFRNTAVAIGDGSGRYVKRRLVPFGEYVPLEDQLRGLIEFFDLPMSHAEPGAWRQPLLQIDGARAAMAICYEVVYPELVREQAQRADVLLTISNDTWFGSSIGPLQHEQMARMRALENGRWMLRGTNNGVTSIIDSRGAVRAALPQFEAGVLRGEFALMSGTTPFTRYGQLPLLLGMLLCLIGLLALRLRDRRARSR